MTRVAFFIDQTVSVGGEAVLTGGTAHHVIHVLRLRPGDRVELRDGAGAVWNGVIAAIEGGEARVAIESERGLDVESPLDLTLAVALGRNDRMDLIVRQATELGVTRIAAFRSERGQYGLKGEREGKRRERWERIVREALCQCRRSVVPEIHLFKDANELLRFADELESGMVSRDAESAPPGSPILLKIIAAEDFSNAVPGPSSPDTAVSDQDIPLQGSLAVLHSKYPNVNRVLALVGPEGGWAPGEVERFMAAGFHPVSLGPRILRMETAAAAIAAAIQLLWGDLGGPA